MQNDYSSIGYSGLSPWRFQETIDNCALILKTCREKKIPVIHVVMAMDKQGILAHKKDPRDEKGVPCMSVKGTKSQEIVSELTPIEGEMIVEKQRFSAFFQTNLELVLQGLGAKHLIMVGCYTDICYATTVYDAMFRGYEITIVKDAVTCECEGAHKAQILNFANWIYDCSIFKTKELIKALQGKEYNAWFMKEMNSFQFTPDQIDEMYDSL